MSDGTKIEWTDTTWNPVTGCTKVSEGCENCYIERTPPFRMEGRRFSLPIIGGTTGVRLHEDRLGQPLHWRKPRKVFVNSLADLFHEDVPDAYIARIFATMAASPTHTFQVLTKRHARMRSLLTDSGFKFRDAVWHELCDLIGDYAAVRFPGAEMTWPLPNVWLGVSVESQKWADWRTPALLDTPAAVRWLSCEPLLGPVDLFGRWDHGCEEVGPAVTHEGVQQRTDYGTGVEYDCDHQAGIDWVVVGGESGPGARPMHPEWARSLRDQCDAASVPFLFKQWGEWAPQDVPRYSDLMPMAGDGRGCVVELDGGVSAAWTMGGRDAREGAVSADGAPMLLVGKKRAGRELDGRAWDEYPAISVGADT